MKNKLLMVALIALTGSAFTGSSLFALNPESDLGAGRLFGKNEAQNIQEKAINQKLFEDIKNTTNYRTPILYKNSEWYILSKEYDLNKKVYGTLQKHDSYFALNNKTITFNEATGEVKLNPAQLTGLGQLFVGSGIAALAAKIYYDTYGASLPEGLQEQVSKTLGTVSTGASQAFQKYAPQTLKDVYEKGYTKAGALAGQASTGFGSLLQTGKTGISQATQTGTSYAGSAYESLKAAPGKLKEAASQYTPSTTPSLSDVSQTAQDYFNKAKQAAQSYFSTAPAATSTVVPE